MGGIGGMFGLGGGAAGTGFSGPQLAPISNPTNPNQIQSAYDASQGGLQQQQALLNALQAQNGIQNQTNTYNQLQGIINGTGPNPAQAMLNQATGQNVANQAALMAGQRGASSNVGLLARQAAQQGAQTQQQAVGQGATMQAQQALNAIGAAGNLSGQQVANQIGQTGNLTQANLAEQQALLNAQANFNAQQVSNYGNLNSNNTQLAGSQLGAQHGVVGGVLSSLGPVGFSLAQGGEVPHMADGGDMGIYPPAGPQSSFGQFLASMNAGNQMVGASSTPVPELQDKSHTAVKGKGAQMLSKIGSSTSSPESQPPGQGGQGEMMPVAEAHGGKVKDFRSGGSIKASDKAEKAVKKGNSYSNDKIPAVLSEGEYVIDRETMGAKDPGVQTAINVIKNYKAQKGKRK